MIDQRGYLLKTFIVFSHLRTFFLFFLALFFNNLRIILNLIPDTFFFSAMRFDSFRSPQSWIQLLSTWISAWLNLICLWTYRVIRHEWRFGIWDNYLSVLCRSCFILSVWSLLAILSLAWQLISCNLMNDSSKPIKSHFLHQTLSTFRSRNKWVYPFVNELFQINSITCILKRLLIHSAQILQNMPKLFLPWFYDLLQFFVSIICFSNSLSIKLIAIRQCVFIFLFMTNLIVTVEHITIRSCEAIGFTSAGVTIEWWFVMRDDEFIVRVRCSNQPSFPSFLNSAHWWILSSPRRARMISFTSSRTRRRSLQWILFPRASLRSCRSRCNPSIIFIKFSSLAYMTIEIEIF